ncbi:MAG: hypothetical protein H6661_01070 [Ardenticatenaceae bacterium]|nr:hypothetical protein [Ardenticatenaceae bacterium]
MVKRTPGDIVAIRPCAMVAISEFRITEPPSSSTSPNK